MALLERLAILITADASGALSEMKKVADGAERDLGKAGASGSALVGNMTKVGAAMVGVGAGLLAVGINAASTTEALGTEVIKLQRYTGMTAEEASKLAYAAKMSGVSVDTLTTNLARMAKAMETSPKKFIDLGVEVNDSSGKMRSMGDVLMDTADKFKSMGPGAESTAKAMQLFGRSGADMLPFLLKGKEGIAELTGEAEKMGLVLSQDNVQAVKDYKIAQRELGAALTGVKNQIGLEMMPILTAFANAFTGMPSVLKDIAGPLVVVGGGIALVGGAAMIAAGRIQAMVISYQAMSVAGQTAVAALGAVGAALTAVAIMYSLYEGGVQRAAAAQGKLNAETLRNAKAGSFKELGDTIAETSKQLDKYAEKAGKKGWMSGDFFFWDRSKAEGQYQDTDKLLKQLQNYETVTNAIAGATGKSKDEVYQWVVTQGDAGHTFDDAAVAIGVYTGKIDTNTLSAGDAKLAQEGLAASINSAADAARAATDPYFAVIHAQSDLATAKKDYDDLVASGTATQDQLDAAYLKQVESAMKLQSTLATLATSSLEGKTGFEKFKGAMDLLKQFGIDPASEAGQRLIEKISGISWQAALTGGYLNDHPLGVKVDDKELAALNARLETLRGMVDPETGLLSYGDIMIFSSSQAVGGRVGPGMAIGGRTAGPHLVGELGPELFWPDSAGTILTAEKTSKMLGSTGGGTSVTNHIVINMPPGSNGADVVDAIKRYEKLNGKTWRK